MLQQKLRPEKKVRQVLKDLKFNMEKSEPEPVRYPLWLSVILLAMAAGLLWWGTITLFTRMLGLGTSAFELLGRSLT